MMQLSNKVIVVTGGGRGLGRAYCEAMAKQGASVVAADIRDTKATVDAVTGYGELSSDGRRGRGNVWKN